MKFYATVTSERATKGQGGNKFLEIIVNNEDEVNLLTIHAQPSIVNDDILITIEDRVEKKLIYKKIFTKQKGEKQKDEDICDKCGYHLTRCSCIK